MPGTWVMVLHSSKDKYAGLNVLEDVLPEDRSEALSLLTEWRVKKIEVVCKTAEVIKTLQEVASKITWIKKNHGVLGQG